MVTQGISAADSSFVTHELSIDPSLLKQSHSYSLLVTTNLAAAALLSNIRVAYDDISLIGTVESGGSGGTGGTGGNGDTGGTGGTGGGRSRRHGHDAGGLGRAARLDAPRVVRFQRGRSITLRVHAARAGKAVSHLAITVRVGNTTRRASTGPNGLATLKVSLKGAGPVRITFRSGAASATTWARAGAR